MKKTIWRPLVLGGILGLLAGISTVSGLSFIVPSTIDTDNAIGFFMILLLLAAALGGPLAGAIASSLLITITAFFGSAEMREIIGDPVNFWTNMFVVGILMVIVGLAYRWIFERVKMPARLLPWAGVVIFVHILNSPANIAVQSYIKGESGILPEILASYKTYIPQAIFDIFFTSLVFIALPAPYRKPLWYESKKAPDRNDEIPDE